MDELYWTRVNQESSQRWGNLTGALETASWVQMPAFSEEVRFELALAPGDEFGMAGALAVAQFRSTRGYCLPVSGLRVQLRGRARFWRMDGMMNFGRVIVNLGGRGGGGGSRGRGRFGLC